MDFSFLSFLGDEATQAAIANLFLLVVSGVAAVLAKGGYDFIKSHTTNEQFAFLQALATDAVQAAEQGAIAGFVADKKAVALALVQQALDKAGIKVAVEQMSAAIEAAVLREFNSDVVVTDSIVDSTPSEGSDDAVDTTGDESVPLADTD